MKPKIGDKIFIEKCDLINKENFLAEIQAVSFGERKLAKILDMLWFDITYFEYNEQKNIWQNIKVNNIDKSLVKYDKNK